jgi:hypothetical protein
MSPEQARQTINYALPNMAIRKDNILRGLNILTKYDHLLEQDTHNQRIYAGNFAHLVEVMSDEDVERMAELGWLESEESWSHNL